MESLTDTKVIKLVNSALSNFEENFAKKRNENNGLQGWRRTGIVILVLAAIATPIMTVLWQASERVSQLDTVTTQVQELRDDFKDMRLREIANLQKEVRELREIVIRIDQNNNIPWPMNLSNALSVSPGNPVRTTGAP